MRTRAEIRNEMDVLDGAVASFSDPEVDQNAFGVTLMRDALDRRREVLDAELKLIESADLAMILDGAPVRDGVVEVDYLVRLLQPFEKAVASVAQALEDAATRAGLIPSAIRDLATLRLRATFAGSFGLALTGPELAEAPALSLFDEFPQPLFDRAVSRLLAVVDAAHDPDAFEQGIIEEIGDLGQRTVSHFTDFAKAVSSTGAPVEFHWADPGEPKRRVIVSPLVAERLQDVLTHIETSDDEQPIAGRLVEASLPRRTFGIQISDDDIVRGTVSAEVAHRIEDYFGKDVRGTVSVRRTVSTTSEKHAEKYTLLEFAGPLGE